MEIQIIGDTDFDGKIVCLFVNGEKQYRLSFDMEDWVDISIHGVFGGNYYQTAKPYPLKFEFDHKYEVEIDDARKWYETLYSNGWR